MIYLFDPICITKTLELHTHVIDYVHHSFVRVSCTLLIRGDMAYLALSATWLHGLVGFHRRSFKVADEACPGDTLECQIMPKQHVTDLGCHYCLLLKLVRENTSHHVVRICDAAMDLHSR